jgi:hypothetical protein
MNNSNLELFGVLFRNFTLFIKEDRSFKKVLSDMA